MISIKTTNVNYNYPNGLKALKDINFEVEEGSKVALLGANGAGKSTLFLTFNGLIRPTSGTILVDGEEVKYDNKSLMKLRQKIGIVFQNPDDQLIAPTVSEDVAYGPLNIGLSKEEINERVKESLNQVGMEGFEKIAPHQLSGGEKKRVAIAGILAMRPKIMVLDEPTSGLDPRGASQIMKLLYQLNENGITILISTHDVDLVPLYSSKVYIMSGGQIIKEGNPQEIFKDVKTIRDANLRLPRIAHLCEILQKEDKISFGKSNPLTIGEDRRSINEYFKSQNELN